MYAVEAINLTKSFKGFKAVDKLNLRVPEGSIYGFLGPNGAGKTTTIKMLTGLSNPTAGDILICGKRVKFGSIRNRKDIGFLPDVPNFYDWMRAEEYLRFSGELFSIEKKVLNARIESLLGMVGLGGTKKKIGSYSRGMKQRLGIAQAMINEPKVVFLDEPTSALDPIGRKEIMEIIMKLSGKVTVFFSTHILSDVERVCNRVIILNKGKAILEDNISVLREKYSRREIVIETDANGGRQKLINELKKTDWLESADENENGVIRIFASDMRKAQTEIPHILSAKNIALKKFEVLEPSLEDIFLKVVNGQ